MEKVVRFGVSVKPELLERFDALIRKEGYMNRSKAISDMMRKELVKREWKDDLKEVIGTITIVYDHDVGNPTDKLLHIQHENQSEISSTTHVHIDEHTCIEVLVVKGNVKKVKELADNIKAIKGVLQGELVTASRTLGGHR